MRIPKQVIIVKKLRKGYQPVNPLAIWFCEFANSDAYNRTHLFNDYQIEKFLEMGFDVEVRE